MLTEATEKRLEVLAHAYPRASVRQLAALSGLSKSTVMRARKQWGAALPSRSRPPQPESDCSALRAELAQLRAQLDEAEHRARVSEARAVVAEDALRRERAARQAAEEKAERAKHYREKYRNIADRRGAAIRDYRRGDLWYRRAVAIGFAVFDLLPEEIMVPLLMGQDVSVRIEGAAPPHDTTALVLSADQREALEQLREVWTLRESLEIDEDPEDSETAFRDAWTRQLDDRGQGL